MTRILLPWLLIDIVLLAIVLVGIRSYHPGSTPTAERVAIQSDAKHYLP